MLITNNKVYDTLKWIALVGLPAVATAYFAVAQIWGLPDAEKVIGSVVALDTALGSLLHISSSQYSAPSGVMEVLTKPDGSGKTFSLNLDGDPEHLQNKDKVVFKVKHVTPVQQKVAERRQRPQKRTNSS